MMTAEKKRGRGRPPGSLGEATIERILTGSWEDVEGSVRMHFIGLEAPITECRRFLAKDVIDGTPSHGFWGKPASPDDCAGCRKRVDLVVNYLEQQGRL